MNLSVKIGNLELKNPVMGASGTFGFGREYEDFLDVNEIGAIVTKGVTPNLVLVIQALELQKLLLVCSTVSVLKIQG